MFIDAMTYSTCTMTVNLSVYFLYGKINEHASIYSGKDTNITAVEHSSIMLMCFWYYCTNIKLIGP